jgi:hypothetical protein
MSKQKDKLSDGYAAEGLDKLNAISENETGAFISILKRKATK